jgi:RNA polymerase sigma-70 factor (ECF subfamily)
VRQYQDKLFHIAYGLTLDAEEGREIVQEVFLNVFSNIHTFREEATLYTWLRRITINQCLNWRRKWKRRFKQHHRSLEKEDTYAMVERKTDKDNPETLYERKDLKRALNQALKSLPQDARTAFVLKEVEGLSYDEIAGILKIKKGTVSSRIYYARQRLKGLLFEREREK